MPMLDWPASAVLGSGTPAGLAKALALRGFAPGLPSSSRLDSTFNGVMEGYLVSVSLNENS
jgi:hypothetical protein